MEQARVLKVLDEVLLEGPLNYKQRNSYRVKALRAFHQDVCEMVEAMRYEDAEEVALLPPPLLEDYSWGAAP